jgi:hypothetical protein
MTRANLFAHGLSVLAFVCALDAHDLAHAQGATSLPYPDPQFHGQIGRTTADSKADFPEPVIAPKAAPNVLLILADDVGFGASSTFGGPISTPTLDSLASHGVKYNRFHTTALCSPTRAALITGRDQHNAHTGIIMERSLGTDIAPTILEAAKIGAPDTIDGVKQRPMDGVSMAYTWDDAKAKDRRTQQIFEMFGNRAIYQNGWMASTTPLVFAWQPEPKGLTPDSFNWELYDLDDDFSQGHDLAKENPQKLSELKELWWAEAGRNNVLPLNFSPLATVQAVFQRPNLTRGRTHFVCRQGTVRIPEGTAPAMKNTSYTVTADVDAPEGGGDGVLVTQGGRFAGWGLVMLDGKPVWTYKRSQVPGAGIRIDGSERLSPGKHQLAVHFAYDGKKGEVGRGGAYTLKVDGKLVGKAKIERTVPYIYSVDETLDIGEDRGTPILENYAGRMPFRYDGRIDEVDIDLEPSTPDPTTGPAGSEIE